jgi:hypothetical protein
MAKVASQTEVQKVVDCLRYTYGFDYWWRGIAIDYSKERGWYAVVRIQNGVKVDLPSMMYGVKVDKAWVF